MLLDRSMISSYRLSVVTISLTVTGSQQTAMRDFSGRWDWRGEGWSQGESAMMAIGRC